MSFEDWATLRLDQVATQFVDRFDVQAEESYFNLGVKWYAEGVFAREPKRGSEIKAKHLYRVKPGQFMYNKLFATEGSFALVRDQHTEGVVSNEFPVFDLDRTRLLPRFLELHFQQPTVWADVAQECVGTTKSRSRWKEERFLAYSLSVPPLPEQRRIVDLIGAVDDAIEAAEIVSGELGRFYAAAIHGLPHGRLSKNLQTQTELLVADLITQIGSGRSPVLDTEGKFPVFGSNGRVGSSAVGNKSAGTIVLGRVGANCGSVQMPDSDFWATDNTLCVSATSGVPSRYLFHLLRGLQLNQFRSGSGQPLITQSTVKERPVVIPAIIEMERIAELLDSLEEASASASAQIASLRRLRAELLAALLSDAHRIPETYDELMGA